MPGRLNETRRYECTGCHSLVDVVRVDNRLGLLCDDCKAAIDEYRWFSRLVPR